TVGSQMERRRIGNSVERATPRDRDAGRVDRHRDTDHLEWPLLRAGSARLYRRRTDVMRAGNHDYRDSWIGVVGGEGARADKLERLAGLAGSGCQRAGGLRAPIVESIGELNGATSGLRRDMEDSSIGEA